jgi:hypothetical protein
MDAPGRPDFVEFFKELDGIARRAYSGDGCPPITAALQRRGGELVTVCFDAGPERNPRYLQIMRLMALAFEAVHFGFVMDAWYVKGAKPGDPVPVAEHRLEGVMVMAYQLGSPLPSMNAYRVARPELGGRRVLTIDPDGGGLIEWGAHVLPSKPAPPWLPKMARQALDQMGVPLPWKEIVGSG